MPSTAAIAPSPAGTASSIRMPLLRTTFIASAISIPPADTIALYSPRLRPAVTSGVRPHARMDCSIAIPVVSSAIWVNSV